MKRKHQGFTLVEIMIVVAILAILALLATSGLLRSRVSANEATAQATLRAISTACETFSISNSGSYPDAEADLTTPAYGPAYLNKSYDGKIVSGYEYSCIFGSSQYTCTARPHVAGKTGTSSYTITSGGVLITGNAS